MILDEAEKLEAEKLVDKLTAVAPFLPNTVDSSATCSTSGMDVTSCYLTTNAVWSIMLSFTNLVWFILWSTRLASPTILIGSSADAFIRLAERSTVTSEESFTHESLFF